MVGILSIARATHAQIVRTGIFYLTLFIFAIFIYLSQILTLFTFYMEAQTIIQMGIASISLWGFILIVITCGNIVSSELEDRTALMLLSKPISRTQFLVGKYFGLMFAILKGAVFLALVLLLTLWLKFGMPILDSEDYHYLVQVKKMPWYQYFYDYFIKPKIFVALQGILLSFLQVSVIACLGCIFFAFFSVALAVSLVSAIFILGNICSYIFVSLDNIKFIPFKILAMAIYYLFPNLGYFSLQSYFSQGKVVSAGYMLLMIIYALLYVTTAMVIATKLFSRREIR